MHPAESTAGRPMTGRQGAGVDEADRRTSGRSKRSPNKQQQQQQQQPLTGATVFVDARLDNGCSMDKEYGDALRKLGAVVRKRLPQKMETLTHLVWSSGRQVSAQRAADAGVNLVDPSWVLACQQDSCWAPEEQHCPKNFVHVPGLQASAVGNKKTSCGGATPASGYAGDQSAGVGAGDFTKPRARTRQGKEGGDGGSGSWTCGQCTFDNAAWRRRCFMCYSWPPEVPLSSKARTASADDGDARGARACAAPNADSANDSACGEWDGYKLGGGASSSSSLAKSTGKRSVGGNSSRLSLASRKARDRSTATGQEVVSRAETRGNGDEEGDGKGGGEERGGRARQLRSPSTESGLIRKVAAGAVPDSVGAGDDVGVADDAGPSQAEDDGNRSGSRGGQPEGGKGAPTSPGEVGGAAVRLFAGKGGEFSRMPGFSLTENTTREQGGGRGGNRRPGRGGVNDEETKNVNLLFLARICEAEGRAGGVPDGREGGAVGAVRDHTPDAVERRQVGSNLSDFSEEEAQRTAALLVAIRPSWQGDDADGAAKGLPRGGRGRKDGQGRSLSAARSPKRKGEVGAGAKGRGGSGGGRASSRGGGARRQPAEIDASDGRKRRKTSPAERESASRKRNKGDNGGGGNRRGRGVDGDGGYGGGRPDELEGVVRVAFSGLTPAHRQAAASMVRCLSKNGKNTPPGSGVCNSEGEAFTHLVIPDESRRTLKVLFALCAPPGPNGKPPAVVTVDWLYASLEAGHFVDAEAFRPARYRGPSSSMGNAEGLHSISSRLLSGERVMVGGVANPPPDAVEKLARAAGAEITRSLREATVLLVGSENELQEWVDGEKAAATAYHPSSKKRKAEGTVRGHGRNLAPSTASSRNISLLSRGGGGGDGEAGGPVVFDETFCGKRIKRGLAEVGAASGGGCWGQEEDDALCALKSADSVVRLQWFFDSVERGVVVDRGDFLAKSEEGAAGNATDLEDAGSQEW